MRAFSLSSCNNRSSLEEALSSAGFDAGLPTFFIWEGVTNYLTAEAVDATFRSIRGLAENSSIAFTYVDKAVLETSGRFEGTSQLRRLLARAGERWTFGLDPLELREYLRPRGFRLVEDLGSVEFRQRYLGNNPRELRGYQFYRVPGLKSWAIVGCPSGTGSTAHSLTRSSGRRRNSILSHLLRDRDAG